MSATISTKTVIPFDNSYAALPERFYARLAPTPVKAPRLVKLNEPLAWQLGLDPDFLRSTEGVSVLSGTSVPDGAAPLAMAYAGHQFGNFVPQLGDGRAILLGEVIDRDGARRDIQLKGSGPTPFSRSGDGRAALGPVLREYIVSEAFAGLGIPATRALAAVMTGDFVFRENVLPGAILTRVASSHVRVGTFQYFAARGDVDALRELVGYAIGRHYPELKASEKPARALLDAVMRRQAALVAQWLHVGFIHGVMNTDNCSIAGETIDFGPCAFVDTYHPGTVFSSIDAQGRYAYGNQPRIAQWNMARLAETLLPLLDDDKDAALAQAQEAIDGFGEMFNAAYVAGFRRKLGLMAEREGDLALGQELLSCMADGEADFTLTFRGLSRMATDTSADPEVAKRFMEPSAFAAWATKWRARLEQDGASAQERATVMRAANPAFIPRNHLVEAAIDAAVGAEDFGPFERLVSVLAWPYEDQPEAADLQLPPRPEQVVRQTFCGT